VDEAGRNELAIVDKDNFSPTAFYLIFIFHFFCFFVLFCFLLIKIKYKFNLNN